MLPCVQSKMYSKSGKYNGGHGGGGQDLPPLSDIDTFSKAGPSRIRYGENDLPKICHGGKGLPMWKNKAAEEKPEACEPPVMLDSHTMVSAGGSLKSYNAGGTQGGGNKAEGT